MTAQTTTASGAFRVFHSSQAGSPELFEDGWYYEPNNSHGGDDVWSERFETEAEALADAEREEAIDREDAEAREDEAAREWEDLQPELAREREEQWSSLDEWAREDAREQLTRGHAARLEAN